MGNGPLKEDCQPQSKILEQNLDLFNPFPHVSLIPTCVFYNLNINFQIVPKTGKLGECTKKLGDSREKPGGLECLQEDVWWLTYRQWKTSCICSNRPGGMGDSSSPATVHLAEHTMLCWYKHLWEWIYKVSKYWYLKSHWLILKLKHFVNIL